MLTSATNRGPVCGELGIPPLSYFSGVRRPSCPPRESPSQRGGQAQLFQGSAAARRCTKQNTAPAKWLPLFSRVSRRAAKLRPCPRPLGGQSRSEGGLGTGSGAWPAALPPRECPPRPLTGEQLRSLGGDGPEQPLRGLRHGGTAREPEGAPKVRVACRARGCQATPLTRRRGCHAHAPSGGGLEAGRREGRLRPRGTPLPGRSAVQDCPRQPAGGLDFPTGRGASLGFLLVLPTRLWKNAQGGLLACRRGWIGAAAPSSFSLPRLSRRGPPEGPLGKSTSWLPRAPGWLPRGLHR